LPLTTYVLFLVGCCFSLCIGHILFLFFFSFILMSQLFLEYQIF
jgi:hypothetical protein